MAKCKEKGQELLWAGPWLLYNIKETLIAIVSRLPGMEHRNVLSNHNRNLCIYATHSSVKIDLTKSTP